MSLFCVFLNLLYTNIMDYKVINLKINSPSVDEAIANLDIEIDICKLSNVKVLKVIHGYGSHGTGGAICIAVRKFLKTLIKQKKIKDMLLGNEWDLSNKKCFDLLENLKDCYKDEDLNKLNPGITIVVL